MVTNIQWTSGFFSQYSSTKAKQNKSAYYKTPTLQEYTTPFFVNLTWKTTQNGSKEEGLPQG